MKRVCLIYLLFLLFPGVNDVKAQHTGQDSYSSSRIGVVGITYSENGYSLDTINGAKNPVRVRDSKILRSGMASTTS